ncbi:MAG: uroporphyrinogen decarboxylase family protein [Planctomycetota bacterium]
MNHSAAFYLVAKQQMQFNPSAGAKRIIRSNRPEKTMNSKQRVIKALENQDPDRIPIDFWAEKIVVSSLMRHLHLTEYEQLLQYFQIDTRYVEGTTYQGPELCIERDGAWKDIWGVVRKPLLFDENNPALGQIQHVVVHPLAEAETIKDVEDYPWPSPDWYEYSIEEETSGLGQYAVVCGADRLNRTAQFKPAMYLRGIEKLLLDLTLNPKIVEALTARLTAYYLEYNKKIFDRANGNIDIFFMGDDFGIQEGMFLSKQMWRKFFKPGFKKFIEQAHSYGIKVMHHTCGSIFELIPEFIECGLDILQSLQPRAKGMDFKKIKSEYGKYIAFQGGIDIQGTMPFGTVKQVREDVKRTIETLGQGGGYILCTSHNLQADTPLENILSMYETALDVGTYPLGT